MPATKLDARNSPASPVLSSFLSDLIPTLLMNTAVYTGCRIPINWYNQSNVLLVTKVEGKEQTKEFHVGNSKINLQIPQFIADTTRIEIIQWRDEFSRYELTLESSTNELQPSTLSRPWRQWKDEISQAVGGLDHVIDKITHLINFQLDFPNHGSYGC